MDNYTPENIKYLLRYCIEIKDNKQYKNILLGSFIRYFIKTEDGYKFRSGGILIDKSGIPDYIRLNNRGVSWSVQLKNSIIFYEFSHKEKYKLFEKLIDKQEERILSNRERKINEYKNKSKKIYSIKGELIKDFNKLKYRDYIVCCNKYEKEKITGMYVSRDTKNNIIYNINLKSNLQTHINIDPEFYYIYKVGKGYKEIKGDLHKLQEMLDSF